MTTQTAAPALELNTYGIPVLAPITDGDMKAAHGFEYLEQPLANYGSRLREHGPAGYSNDEYRTCKCGRVFRTANGRGLHESAAEKRASKLYDTECDTGRAAARKS